MTLSLSYAFTITADLAEPRVVGLTPAGHRRVIAITGGQVDGPALTGEVLPGGADWSVVRPDGAVHVWARYEIRSADGAIISVVNDGLGRPASPPASPGAEPGLVDPDPARLRGRGRPAQLAQHRVLRRRAPACRPGRVTIAVHEVVPA